MWNRHFKNYFLNMLHFHPGMYGTCHFTIKQHATACNIPVNAILWLGLCTLCMIQHSTNGQRTCVSIQITYTMILELWKCFLCHFQCPLEYNGSCNHYFLFIIASFIIICILWSYFCIWGVVQFSAHQKVQQCYSWCPSIDWVIMTVTFM
jgi:hypothetical protein